MKKITIILCVIFLFSACAVIDKQYTGRRVITESEDEYGEEYEDYYDRYSYRPSYYYHNI